MDLRIVFMGTPEFAVASLQQLVEAGEQIVGVVTAPDKPKGRGKKMSISAIKEYALSQDLYIMQPTSLKDPEFIANLKSLKADLQIIVAFRMLPEIIWKMPRLGTFNLHASLLPQYRGAAPINWAIINGEKETGVTTFFLRHEIDTGNIIFQEKIAISDTDDVGTVYERLMKKGAILIQDTVDAIVEGKIETKPQLSIKELKSAPKIFKADCEIDWSRKSYEIRNFIRGLSPYPAAWTIMHKKNLKIFKAEMNDEKLKIGSFKNDKNSAIFVGTGDGSIKLLDIQLEGKRRMQIKEFLLGYHWPEV